MSDFGAFNNSPIVGCVSYLNLSLTTHNEIIKVLADGASLGMGLTQTKF